MPAEELIARFPQRSAISPDDHFYPNMDGHIVPDEPLALLRAGKVRMPMMIGYTSDEALFWSRDLPKTVDGYRAYVAGWFPPTQAGEILERYPAASDAEVRKAVARFVTDFKIATPTAQIARGVSTVAPVYAYRFSRVSPANRASFGGAAHTVEVAYVFDVLAPDPAQYDERDRILSKEMADAWVRFVKTGNPNGDGAPEWPAHRGPDYRVMEFGDATTVGAISDNPGIEFFDSKPAGRERPQ